MYVIYILSNVNVIPPEFMPFARNECVKNGVVRLRIRYPYRTYANGDNASGTDSTLLLISGV